MAQCAENIAASCSMRHPLLPVPRAYHVGPDLGLAGGTSSSPWRPTSTTSRATWSAGTTRSTGSHREAHPADSGPARRGPVRVLTRTRPRQFSLSRGAGAGQNSGSQPAGGNTDAGVAAGGRTWLERRLDGKRQHTVAEIAEAVGVHRTRPRNHWWAVPGIVPHHAFHDGSTEPIPVRQPTWPGARTAFPSGRAGAMTDGRPVKTACGVVSLRRPCPDQVPGDRRSAS
jgi:hypothetical protein